MNSSREYDLPASIAHAAQPCLISGQAWPEARQTAFATLSAIERIAKQGFFRGFQITDCPHPEERRALAQLAHDAGLEYNYSLGRLTYQEEWQLAAPDECARRKIVDAVRRQLDHAREAGARFVQVLSGTTPAAFPNRQAALDELGETLAALSGAASAPPAIELLIEPLDVDAHKRGVLGYTHEAVGLTESLPNISLSFDTAHALLNGEDLAASLDLAQHKIGEVHLCNAVCDPARPDYGDHHPPWGPPGLFSVDTAAGLLAKLWTLGYLAPQASGRITLERKRPPGMSGGDLARHARQQLEAAWALARAKLENADAG